MSATGRQQGETAATGEQAPDADAGDSPNGIVAIAPMGLPVLPLVEVQPAAGAQPTPPAEGRKPAGMSLPMA